MGGQVSVTSVGDKQVTMEKNEMGHITVEGVQLVFTDKVATNGVIHVVEDIILTEDSLSVMQHLRKRKTSHLLDLIKAAELDEQDLMANNATNFFLPSEEALEGRRALLQDKKALQK